MIILTIIGIVIITYIVSLPVRWLLMFFIMSDYGFVDTLKWNFFKEKLWVDVVLILVLWPFWWYAIGSHVKIGWK